MMSGENAQSQEDKQMEFSTGFDLHIEDLNQDFNTDVVQDAQKTVRIIQEKSETDDQNVQVSRIRMFRKMLLMLKLLNPKSGKLQSSSLCFQAR